MVNVVLPGFEDTAARAAVGLGDRGDEREAEPRAAGGAGAGAVAAGEALEGVLLQSRGQAGAVVVDGDQHLTGACRRRDRDGRARRGVAARVAEQVGDQLVEPLDVTGHGHRLLGQPQLPPVVGCDDARVGDRLEQQPGHVDLGALERAAGVQPGEQEQVLDQAGHPVGLGLHLGEGRGEGGGVVRRTTGQLGVAVDGGQRGPQLVRGVRDELAHLLLAAVPGLEGLRHVVEHRVQRVPDLADLGLGVGVLLLDPGLDGRLAAGERLEGHLVGAWPRPRASGRSCRRISQRPTRAATATPASASSSDQISRLRIVAWMSRGGQADDPAVALVVGVGHRAEVADGQVDAVHLAVGRAPRSSSLRAFDESVLAPPAWVMTRPSLSPSEVTISTDPARLAEVGVAGAAAAAVRRSVGPAGAWVHGASQRVVHLLVEATGQVLVQGHGRGDHHQRAHQRDEHDHRGHEASASGCAAYAPQPPLPVGLRTYPAPRIVWIIGSRPASIFLRR